jgi:hypothetical protein
VAWVLGKVRWRKLCGRSSRAPLPHAVLPPDPRGVRQWLRGVRARHPDDPPFLPDLAHYEWVELALQVCARAGRQSIDQAGALLDGRPR